MEEMRRREESAQLARKRLVAFELERKETAFDEKEYEEARKKLETARIEEEKTGQKAEYLHKEKKMLEGSRRIYEQELSEIKAIKKKAEAISALVEELKIYKNAVQETQVSLRKSLIDAINSAMNEIWGIFYPYGNYKSIRMEVTDRDYVFEVLENDEWKQLETIASGGERACAALTLRVALAMVLTPSLSWLILDEPTHNLDSEAVALLSETLQTKVPQVVKQTFVITHEEALIGADFSKTYKLSRDKEHNGATKTEVV
jgi:DNA repair exonuclease SbcCD ATPase subunit